jgi:hypothetical protein
MSNKGSVCSLISIDLVHFVGNQTTENNFPKETTMSLFSFLPPSVASWDHCVSLLTGWAAQFHVPLDIAPHVHFDPGAAVIGSGAFASVHHALYRDERVAVKVYSCQEAKVFGNISMYCIALLREIVCLHALTSVPDRGARHIVALRGICIVPNEIWLVLEYAEHTLSALTLGTTDFRRQLALALASVHRFGAHLDLKPDNLRLRDSNTVVLLDFNSMLPLAQAGGDTLLQIGGMTGTHGYMPKEQVCGLSIY